MSNLGEKKKKFIIASNQYTPLFLNPINRYSFMKSISIDTSSFRT